MMAKRNSYYSLTFIENKKWFTIWPILIYSKCNKKIKRLREAGEKIIKFVAELKKK